MRRLPLVLAVLLLLFAGLGPASHAQVGTPVPDLAVSTPGPGADSDLTGVDALPLTGERRAAFEAYVAETMNQLGLPGASIAVVQGDEIVYLQGFGVREAGGSAPVTPDTLMMIGSVTKSMTSTMAATLVDDGWLSWDTPVVDLLPEFAVADPELTPRLSVADAFCACTGIPRRDPEIILNFHSLTPGRIVADMAGLPLTAPFGEQFQYSNQMYAVGGYAAAAAAGAAPDGLYDGYVAAMRERIFNPIGMDRSTFALPEVLGSGDYALPHSADITGQTQSVSLLSDQAFVKAVTPAGALWSSARDMARFVQTEIADGVAPDGTRVVSAANLEQTRAPRVAFPEMPGTPPVFADASQHYGMGWVLGEWRGQPLVSHTGGTFGFGSAVTFLPEADLGLVILTNHAQAAGPFALSVQFRLFELLFNQEPEVEPLLVQFFEAQGAQMAELQAQLAPADPAAVTPFLGRYTNPALGEIELSLRDGKLMFDAGEVRSELWMQTDEAGAVVGYLFADQPLAGSPVMITLGQGTDGQADVAVIVAGDGAETYDLTPLEPQAAATPAP